MEELWNRCTESKLELWELRQKGSEFKASLGYHWDPVLNPNNAKQKGKVRPLQYFIISVVNQEGEVVFAYIFKGKKKKKKGRHSKEYIWFPMVRRHTSGSSSGHFWNYVNVLCKKELQEKKENPWDKGTFMQMSEVKSSKWSLPMENGCSLWQSSSWMPCPRLHCSAANHPRGSGAKESCKGVLKPRLAADRISLLPNCKYSKHLKKSHEHGRELRWTRHQDAETEVALSAERTQESSSVFKGTEGIAITRLSTKGQAGR